MAEPPETLKDRVPSAPDEPAQLSLSGQGFQSRFRAVRELARGGMGRVLVARDLVLRREVAIKEMLPAGDGDSLLRFEREALLTARLQHPGIVSVHEFARQPDGSPCLVMRRVRGAPFDEAIARAAKLEDRLALLGPFVRACEAVAYAHDRGVIHRDLKPGNVLLGEFGDTVVIDWGLAKDMNAPADEPPDRLRPGPRASGALTSAGSVMGTPEYMAPEQARGEALDARCDVYALGAMLYHLLSGRMPYTRAANSDGDDVLEALRKGPPPPLPPEVAPELITVVEHAMAREPERRLAHAGKLADELKRYQTGLLLHTHRYSTRELVLRWMRRHALTLGVSAAFVAALAGLALFSVRRVVAERDRASREAEASKRVTNFLAGMFKVASPEEARGRVVTAREVLDRAAKEIDASLAQDPDVQSKLMAVMGGVYGDLGLYPESEALLRKALETRRRLLGADALDTVSLESNLGMLLYQAGRYAEAEPLLVDALERWRRTQGDDHPNTLNVIGNLANLYDDTARYSEAEKLMRESIERRSRLFGAGQPETLMAQGNLVFVLEHEGRLDDAVALARAVLEEKRRVEGADAPDALQTAGMLGHLLTRQGHYAEAEQAMRANLADLTRVVGPEHPDTLAAMAVLAEISGKQGRLPEAEKWLRQALAADLRVLGAEHPDTLAAQSGLGRVLLDEGRLDEAQALFEKSLAGRRRALGEGHPDTAASFYDLACLWARRGEKQKALDALSEAKAHGLGEPALQSLPADLAALAAAK